MKKKWKSYLFSENPTDTPLNIMVRKTGFSALEFSHYQIIWLKNSSCVIKIHGLSDETYIGLTVEPYDVEGLF